MKLKILWLVLSLLAVSTTVWLMFRSPHKLFWAEYGPTEASKSWFTYTDDEMGFEIKYPSTLWGIRLSRVSNAYASVSFTTDGGKFEIYRHNGAPQSYELAGRKTRIGELEARWSSYDLRNWGGSYPYEQCVVQRGDSTYTIRWTRYEFVVPRADAPMDVIERSKHLRDAPNFREMVGTFRFCEVHQSNRRKYEDKTYHYSFTYPTAWDLNGGGGDTRINDDAKFSLTIRVVSNSTFAEEEKLWGDRFAKVSDEHEFFDHHLVGRRLLWNGDDTYAFEKRGNLYLVTIWLAPKFGVEPEPLVTSILNSLSL